MTATLPDGPDAAAIFKVMRTARAVRRFRPDPVSEDVLRRCLEAATWAPSGGNQQPWRFVVLRSNEARATLGEAAAAALATIESLYRMRRPDPHDNSSRARNDRAVYELHDAAADVPVAVLFTVRPMPHIPPLLLGASVYPAIQNFLLAARAQGLGAVVTGWHLTGEAAIRRVVGVPSDWHLAAVVAAGWPRGRHGPVRRRPVAEFAAVDRWTDPFP
jgi:nitroreductase